MTDRTIRSVADLDSLDFGKSEGLVPIVVQDARTGETLMLAYANRDALEASLSSGEMHFWSRSRDELWRKGETSGNTLQVRSLHADCDADSVLALVVPAGPACHTGEATCFGASSSPEVAEGALTDLAATIEARWAERSEGSYTTRPLADRNLRIKKLGEESAELIAALATGDVEQAIAEAADLVYHIDRKSVV
jgi:phosphoribosyl-ATP pyrophosphohydrolase/phosphoribosyl-AMP cyclohydrolase